VKEGSDLGEGQRLWKIGLPMVCQDGGQRRSRGCAAPRRCSEFGYGQRNASSIMTAYSPFYECYS
jgi:hypothetical protein